jgi:hypothetical protein
LTHRVNKDFTGFLAEYDDGKLVREKNHFFSKLLDRQCATNWAEISLKKLVSLELFWKGDSKIKITKDEHPHIEHSDWFFSHSAVVDASSPTPKIISRNIGYREDGILYVFMVDESTGSLKVQTRVGK